MTKEEALFLMRLLSALEAAGLISGNLPKQLLESISDAVSILQREILK